MRDVFRQVAGWLIEGRSFALATLVELRDAVPAPVGTTIAVDENGTVLGNVGAGCDEADIVTACLATAADGQRRRIDVNLNGDDVIMGGSACGAAMQLLVWRPEHAFAETARAIASGEHDARLTIDGFEHVFAAKTKLVLIGATAVAAQLALLASRLDFDVVVIDPRPSYATRERIPAAQILRVWPDEALPRNSLRNISHRRAFTRSEVRSTRAALRIAVGGAVHRFARKPPFASVAAGNAARGRL